jgi:riboflavin biosynthesis pyrimidine reductase
MRESSVHSDQKLRRIYAWPQTRCFRLNLLVTPEGIAGQDGTSLSLTNSEDRRILRTIRAEADVVIVGAESLRAEGWFLPPHGRLIVLSASGKLPWDTCPDSSRVFVAPSASAIVHNVTSSETRILCEGGLISAEYISERIGFDEVALSTQGLQIPSELDFLHLDGEYTQVSGLVDTAHHMTFRFWRRAVGSRP